MKSRLLASLACLCALAFSAPSPAQLSLRDDVNRLLLVKKPATRVVTLAPFLTEILFAAGAGDLAIGVDVLSDYPAQALSLPRVPSGAEFSPERIASLKPDLVLAWRDGIRPDDVQLLSAAGVTVFVATAHELEDIPRLLRVVGQLTGRDPMRAIVEFEEKLLQLRRENASKAWLSTFIEIWNRPLTTVSGQHFLSEALEICRAENVFGELGSWAPKVSWKDLEAKNPAVIVGAASASSLDEFRANWVIRQGLTAVKRDQLLFVDDSAISRLTPRTPDRIAKLCAALDDVRAGRVQRSLDTGGIADRSDTAVGSAGLGGIPSVANPVVTLPALPASPPSSQAAPVTTVPAPEAASAPTTPAPRRPSQYGL